MRELEKVEMVKNGEQSWSKMVQMRVRMQF